MTHGDDILVHVASPQLIEIEAALMLLVLVLYALGYSPAFKFDAGNMVYIMGV